MVVVICLSICKDYFKKITINFIEVVKGKMRDKKKRLKRNKKITNHIDDDPGQGALGPK